MVTAEQLKSLHKAHGWTLVLELSQVQTSYLPLRKAR